MGTLYIVATPIGNLEDITIRALKMLFSVDVIACEDTRRTGQLLTQLKNRYLVMLNSLASLSRSGFQHLQNKATETLNHVQGDKKPELISFYDEIEESKTYEIIDLIKQDKNVALVSDAGTPLIADPGYKLVRACIKEGIKIISIPGPSSIITALTLSGLPTNNFHFLGYLPTKRNKRISLLKLYSPDSRPRIPLIISTIIAFESPHRISETLSDMKEVFGDIDIVIARELTKIHEEIMRGKISEIEKKTLQIKGELVLLFQLKG